MLTICLTVLYLRDKITGSEPIALGKAPFAGKSGECEPALYRVAGNSVSG